jgi:hypothetical protein
MPTLINHPEATEFTYKFRAFCRDDNWKGTWNKDEEIAKAQATAHKNKPGCEDHTVDIEVKQTYVVSFL